MGDSLPQPAGDCNIESPANHVKMDFEFVVMASRPFGGWYGREGDGSQFRC